MAEKTMDTDSKSEEEFSPWKEYLKAAVIALILALFIRTFIVQAFKIPSESMLQTLQVGDHLLVNKMVYLFGEPERGDIIVFRYPRDPKRDFVKRIIGLPGETIEMTGNIVYINGKPLAEPYAIYLDRFMGGGFSPVTVPPGHLFMMGDNRDNSQDSRVWGALDINSVRGKAFIVHWSWKGSSFGVRWSRIGKLLR